MRAVLDSRKLDGTSDTAYEEFIEHYSKDRDRLFAYIYALVPHQADAEDVFQRSSLIIWSKFSDFDRGRPFLPWACSIAHYEVRNFLRSVRRDRLYFDEVLVEQIAVLRSRKLTLGETRLDALRLCMERMNLVEKELIERVYGSEASIKELAETKGIAVQTLYNRISLARSKLLGCLKMRFEQTGDSR